MVEVPGVIVNNPGSPAAFQLPDTFIIEDPKLSNLTAAVLQPACELNDDQVHVVPFVFKVPLRKSTPLKLLFAPKLTTAPEPLIYIQELVPLELD